MCGIAGIIGGGNYQDDITRMLEVQKHRGPDNIGVYFDKEYCVLGHNRLSIIDLSAEANQPYISACGEYIIVFNGEIYNYLELKLELGKQYKFKTDSDTEVLLAAYIVWGKDCLNKLNGMFSFAIWNTKSKKVFAARDRFGVKPFYYYKTDGFFTFASEIKTIQALGVGLKFKDKVWADYFMYGSYGQPNETFYDEIFQLPGGYYLELENNQITITKWYDFVSKVKSIETPSTIEGVKSAYVSLLKDSISLRFRSDVNVGFNISGGLDSSTLLAFINEYNSKDKIKAFTFYTGDERYDELPWVEEMISLTNNPLERVKLTPKEVLVKAQNIASKQDEPYGGIPTLAYAKIFETASEQNIKVLLDGQGMDEQWAGYDYYQKSSNQIIQGVNKSPFRLNCLSKKIKELGSKLTYPSYFDDQIKNLQYRDLFYTKIPRALRFNDRVSMAYSTELREPFLDYRLVEYAFSLPKEFKIKNGQSKYLLREIVKSYMTKKISYSPKRPLQTPQREWLGNELKILVNDSIEKILDSKYSDWFEKDIMINEWKKYLEGDN